ncbi:MAG: hypothetical protein N3E49_04085 [Bacteroidia bacterium]|nr:hypothetical protein [Bacteroidia bacterium]
MGGAGRVSSGKASLLSLRKFAGNYFRLHGYVDPDTKRNTSHTFSLSEMAHEFSMIFAALARQMLRKLGFLWACGVWAQEAFVWDWHGEASSGNGYHQPIGASLPHSRQFSVLRLTGDTLWILGRVCIPSNEQAYFPNPAGAPIPIQIPQVSYRREASYIALYNRLEGTFLGALVAYAQTGAQYGVQFVDFLLSGDRDSLWVAVNLPKDGCNFRSGPVMAAPTIVWQSSTGTITTLAPIGGCSYSMESDQATAQLWQIAKLKTALPAGWSIFQECFYWQGSGALFLAFHGLAYRPGEVFVSGTLELPSGVGSVTSLYPAYLSGAFGPGPPPSGSRMIPFWSKLQTGNVFGVVASAVLHQDGGATGVQGYAQALQVKGDTLLAFYSLHRNGPGDAQLTYKAFQGTSFYIYAQNAYANQCPGNMRGHVFISALRTSDLRPVNATSTSLGPSTFQLFCGNYPSATAVGTLYPWLSGDTLWLLWSDSYPLTLSNTVGLRGLFAYWTGLSTFPTLTIGSSNIPWVESNVLWTGMCRATDGVFFLCGSDGMSSILGQWRSPISSGWITVLSPQVEATGIVADPTGHFYLFGVGRSDNITYHRVRPRARQVETPLGNLTPIIHVLNKRGYGRAWIGRLLRYRAELIAATLPAEICAPDTILHPLTFRLYGRFDAPSDSIALLWNAPLSSPAHYAAPVRFRWTLAGVIPPSGGADTVRITFSPSYMWGRLASGGYYLHLGILGWYEIDNLLPSSIGVQVVGDKAPHSYASESQRYWVYPFSGGPGAHIGWRQAAASGPFQVRTAYLDGNASVSPHYAFTYVPFDPALHRELLYVAINYTDSVLLYRVDIATGIAEVERGWARIPTPNPTWNASEDSIADGIQQLTWNPQTGSLIAVEGGYRLRVIFPSVAKLAPTFPRNITHSLSELHGDLRYFPMVATVSAVGEVISSGRVSNPALKTYILKDDLTDLLFGGLWDPRVVCESEDSGDPCFDFIHNIVSPRAMTYGDGGIYFVDWGRVPTGCAEFCLLLRRTNMTGMILTYTLDTLYRSTNRSDMDSVRFGLVYLPKPTPHLIFPLRLPSGEGYILRYWLDGRPKALDTLIGGVLVGPWSCEYTVDRWSPLSSLPRAISVEMARGGTLLFSATTREIRAALPLYINRATMPDTALWLTTDLVDNFSASRDLNPTITRDSVKWRIDSLRSERDTLQLRIQLSPCGSAWPFVLRTMTLPSSAGSIQAPPMVCVGEVFPIEGSASDELLLMYSRATGNVTECGIERLVENLFFEGGRIMNPAGRLQRLSNGLYVALDTCISPQCRIEQILPAGLGPEQDWLSRLREAGSYVARLQVRRGHQLSARVALQAPLRADDRLAPHPGLSRLGLYRAAVGNAMGDSLTQWGVLGTLPQYWEGGRAAWTRIAGAALADTAVTPSAWRVPSWVTPVLVLLRETPDGPAVDSVWGFVDTLGWIWKWAPPMVDTSDCPNCPDRLYYQPWRLSFCRCDTSTPKWIVIRFPQHLPLRSAQSIRLSQDPSNPTTLDFRDPTYLDGIPGLHYALLPGGGGVYRAAMWAGNCADQFHHNWPGVPQGSDWGVINAADYEFLLLRNGVVSGPIFSPADVDCDGFITAADVVWVVQNQNALRQSSVRD